MHAESKGGRRDSAGGDGGDLGVENETSGSAKQTYPSYHTISSTKQWHIASQHMHESLLHKVSRLVASMRPGWRGCANQREGWCAVQARSAPVHSGLHIARGVRQNDHSRHRSSPLLETRDGALQSSSFFGGVLPLGPLNSSQEMKPSLSVSSFSMRPSGSAIMSGLRF